MAHHMPQEVATFYEGIQAGLNGEDVPLCGPCEDQDEPFDARWGGKGVGGAAADSGKSNQGGSSQAGGFSGPRLFAPPEPGQPDMRVCHCCLRTGHVMKDCRAKKAGKPKAVKGAKFA